jgi:hypothetical protein
LLPDAVLHSVDAALLDAACSIHGNQQVAFIEESLHLHAKPHGETSRAIARLSHQRQHELLEQFHPGRIATENCLASSVKLLWCTDFGGRCF